MVFIDYTKAFDSVKHNSIISALENQGMGQNYIKLIMELYKNIRARVRTDITGESFEIERGVKQGDPLSSILFNCVLEEVFRKLKWSKKGININGEYLNNIRYADDIVLISESKHEIQEMTQELSDEGEKKGLSMNINKTKAMSKENEDLEININGKKIENVKEMIYLGQNITMENKTSVEIERRISIAWKKFWSLKFIFKGNFTIKNKIKVLNSCVMPTLTYGSQTWAMNKIDENKIKVVQNSMERSILGIKLKDRISLKAIRKKIINRVDFLHTVKRLKWDWAGHVARQNKDRWTYSIKNWFLKMGRKKGKQKTKWDDDIIKFLGYNKQYHRVANDRREWSRLREAYAQHWA